MTLESCYAMMGGDLEGVRGRLRSDERVAKFVSMFPHDESFAALERAMAEKAWPEAFRAAHTLKGVSRDLGFTTLFEASDELASVLRPAKDGNAVDEQAAAVLVEKVGEVYQLTLDALKTIDE